MSEAKLDGAERDVVVKEWADDYPEGAELFCSRFDSADFADPRYTVGEYPDGASVAVLAFAAPPPGWVLRNLHLSEDERSKLLLVQSSSAKALDIILDLDRDPFQDFFNAWTAEVSASPGKSPRSSKRSASTKTPSDGTSSD